MGHVLLVMESPRGVHRGSKEAGRFQSVWPRLRRSATDDVKVLWIVRTLESTRNEDGLHDTDQLIYMDGKGRMFLAAEEQFEKFVVPEGQVQIQAWQSPPALRNDFRVDIMNGILADLIQHEANWSWSTAVRAFFLSANMQDASEDGTLREIQSCWSADPICSSLVIVFWQRYLCKLAELYNVSRSPMVPEVLEIDWILKWMPLKSDRALPGELLSAMQQCGWIIISDFRSREGLRKRSFTY